MARLLSTALGAALMTTGAFAAPAASVASTKRVLIVFSANDDPRLRAQTTLLGTVPAAEIAERDLLVLHVLPNGETKVLFGDRTAGYPAETLRRAQSVPFAVVLVGKDGGEKWRTDRPARPEELFGLIDKMPMRAIEMKRNRPAG